MITNRNSINLNEKIIKRANRLTALSGVVSTCTADEQSNESLEEFKITAMLMLKLNWSIITCVALRQSLNRKFGVWPSYQPLITKCDGSDSECHHVVYQLCNVAPGLILWISSLEGCQIDTVIKNFWRLHLLGTSTFHLVLLLANPWCNRMTANEAIQISSSNVDALVQDDDSYSNLTSLQARNP